MSNYPAHRVLMHLPEFYQDFLEFAELDRVETGLLNQAEDGINAVLDNAYVETMDSETIKRMEVFFGIVNQPDEDLDFRRLRLLNRIQTKPPFTKLWLQQKLDDLLGPGATIVEVDGPNFTLYVSVNIEDAALFREFNHLIATVKPANIIYQQRTSMNSNLELVHNISYKPVTYNYKLGSWQLGALPFRSLGSEVIIK